MPSQLVDAYYKKWLRNHLVELDRFLYSRFPIEDHHRVARILYEHSEIGYYAVKDFLLPNSTKLKKVIDYFSTGSKIFIVVGRRGSGKTALVSYLSYFAHSYYDRRVFYYGAFKVPAFASPLFSLDNVVKRDLVIFDESSILLNARDSVQSKNRTILDYLPILRHKGLSVVFISQSSSLLDINTFRLADGYFLTPLSLLSLSSPGMERETIIDDATMLLLPLDVGEVLFRSSSSLYTFNFPLPDWFTEDLSHAYDKIPNEDIAIAFAKSLFANDWSLKDIKRILGMYGFSKPLSYWHDILHS